MKGTNQKLVRCGRLFDGVHEELMEKMEIRIEGDRIAAVGRCLPVEGECEVIDLSSLTVTPGMLDAHTHLSGFQPLNRDKEIFFNSPVYKAMAVLYNADSALRSGFTTIRHMGASSYDAYGSLDAKRVINEGYFPGARLVVMPYVMSTPGGHGDCSQKAAPYPQLAEFLAKQFPTIGSGVDFFTNAVREQVKYGADLIKMMPGGGFATPNDAPDDEQLSDDEMRAIIDTAHSLHKKTTAHVYADGSIVKLIEYGLDEFQHCSLMSEPTLELMEKKGVPLVPTLTPFESVVHPGPGELPYYAIKMLKYKEKLTSVREMIFKSGLTLGYGTDAMDPKGGYYAGMEYAAWLRSGASPWRALKAATSVNAKLFGLSDSLGSIEEGKIADLAGWSGELLTDPDALKQCAFVMKDGKVFAVRGESN